MNSLAASVTIDRAATADLSSVAGIERAAFADPWSERSFSALLANDEVYFAVLRRGDEPAVLGYVVAWFVLDEAEIANLAVRPADWGRGLGGVLLDGVVKEAQRRGCAAIYLEMRDSNTRARALYLSRGFIEVGRRHDYYRRPVEDAVVWRKEIGM